MYRFGVVALGSICWTEVGKILEPEPHLEPLAKRVENASLATFSGHLKGGVRDPRFMTPIYV